MFFEGQNGMSGTMGIQPKDLMIFVSNVTDTEKEAFRKSLVTYLQEGKKLEALRAELSQKLMEAEQKYVEKMHEHIRVLRELHTKYGKEMVLATYNEFDHKIHVENNGKMFVVAKDTDMSYDLPQTVESNDVKKDDNVSSPEQ